MATSENENRRLQFADSPENFKVHNVKGWPVVDKNNDEIGKVKGLLADEKNKRLRYLDVEIYKGDDSSKIAAIPVGLFTLDKPEERLLIEDVDSDFIKNSPLHEPEKLITYKDEMRIRAYFEVADSVDVKTGNTAGPGGSNMVDREDAAVGSNSNDTEDSYKRDKELNEGRIADEMQGRYTPNLNGDAEGVKKPATNAEGKHDIKASSGNPENPPAGNINPETEHRPEGTEAITSDKPGETLGRAEIENRYRDPENQQLPGAMKNPEPPLNANDDFYRHELFNDSRIRGE